MCSGASNVIVCDCAADGVAISVCAKRALLHDCLEIGSLQVVSLQTNPDSVSSHFSPLRNQCSFENAGHFRPFVARTTAICGAVAIVPMPRSLTVIGSCEHVHDTECVRKPHFCGCSHRLSCLLFQPLMASSPTVSSAATQPLALIPCPVVARQLV